MVVVEFDVDADLDDFDESDDIDYLFMLVLIIFDNVDDS